jgi:hypothetical protein
MVRQLTIDAGPSPESALLNPDFRDILSAFIGSKVEFLVVGGYTVAAHRLPRATKGLHIWVRPSPENGERVLNALDAFGAARHDLSASDLATEGTIYQVGVPPNRIDVLTLVEGVQFQDAWRDRSQIDIEGLLIPVIGKTHLITNKRTVRRPQDLLDADLLDSSGQ